ncbi:MAG: hypothetical protein Q4D21_07250 [Phascolarctobacterium sp.]|nr:hypothetical protein [Phascolarctobacterium sp.]
MKLKNLLTSALFLPALCIFGCSFFTPKGEIQSFNYDDYPENFITPIQCL